jgi:hypothetical protein
MKRLDDITIAGLDDRGTHLAQVLAHAFRALRMNSFASRNNNKTRGPELRTWSQQSDAKASPSRMRCGDLA